MSLCPCVPLSHIPCRFTQDFLFQQVETSPSSRNTRHSSVSGGISPSPNPSQNPAQPSTASAAVPRGGFLEPAPNTLRIEDLGTSEQGGRHDSARGGLSSSSHAPILRRGAKPLDGSGSVLKMVFSVPRPETSSPQCGPDHPCLYRPPSIISHMSHPLKPQIFHCIPQP